MASKLRPPPPPIVNLGNQAGMNPSNEEGDSDSELRGPPQLSIPGLGTVMLRRTERIQKDDKPRASSCNPPNKPSPDQLQAAIAKLRKSPETRVMSASDNYLAQQEGDTANGASVSAVQNSTGIPKAPTINEPGRPSLRKTDRLMKDDKPRSNSCNTGHPPNKPTPDQLQAAIANLRKSPEPRLVSANEHYTAQQECENESATPNASSSKKNVNASTAKSEQSIPQPPPIVRAPQQAKLEKRPKQAAAASISTPPNKPTPDQLQAAIGNLRKSPEPRIVSASERYVVQKECDETESSLPKTKTNDSKKSTALQKFASKFDDSKSDNATTTRKPVNSIPPPPPPQSKKSDTKPKQVVKAAQPRPAAATNHHGPPNKPSPEQLQAAIGCLRKSPEPRLVSASDHYLSQKECDDQLGTDLPANLSVCTEPIMGVKSNTKKSGVPKILPPMSTAVKTKIVNAANNQGPPNKPTPDQLQAAIACLRKSPEPKVASASDQYIAQQQSEAGEVSSWANLKPDENVPNNQGLANKPTPGQLQAAIANLRKSPEPRLVSASDHYIAQRECDKGIDASAVQQPSAAKANNTQTAVAQPKKKRSIVAKTELTIKVDCPKGESAIPPPPSMPPCFVDISSASPIPTECDEDLSLDIAVELASPDYSVATLSGQTVPTFDPETGIPELSKSKKSPKTSAVAEKYSPQKKPPAQKKLPNRPSPSQLKTSIAKLKKSEHAPRMKSAEEIFLMQQKWDLLQQQFEKCSNEVARSLPNRTQAKQTAKAELPKATVSNNNQAPPIKPTPGQLQAAIANLRKSPEPRLVSASDQYIAQKECDDSTASSIENGNSSLPPTASSIPKPPVVAKTEVTVKVDRPKASKLNARVNEGQLPNKPSPDQLQTAITNLRKSPGPRVVSAREHFNAQQACEKPTGQLTTINTSAVAAEDDNATVDSTLNQNRPQPTIAEAESTPETSVQQQVTMTPAPPLPQAVKENGPELEPSPTKPQISINLGQDLTADVAVELASPDYSVAPLTGQKLPTFDPKTGAPETEKEKTPKPKPPRGSVLNRYSPQKKTPTTTTAKKWPNRPSPTQLKTAIGKLKKSEKPPRIKSPEERFLEQQEWDLVQRQHQKKIAEMKRNGQDVSRAY